MNLGKVLRIARWEVTKNAGGVDKRTVAVAGIALLAVALVAPYAATQGVALDSGIYRVGVDEASPYYDVVDSDPTFTVHDPDPEALEAGDIDILIQGAAVVHADTRKGEAATEELHSTVVAYNDRQMRTEANQSAAFPVVVSLDYVQREGVQDVIAAGAEDGSGTSGSDDGSGGGGDGSTDDGSGGDTGSADGDGGDGSASGSDGGSASDAEGGGLGGIAGQLAGDGSAETPSDVTPPFPFRSLVLAFLFVVPLNFIIQAYGSTMLSERLNRRGELLLVAPVSRFDIIAGKTLPYLTAALGIAALLAAGLEAPAVDPVSVVLSVLAVAPIALLFLSATFVGAMFARSFKELTFVTVTVTVSLTSYAFVPAIFTDVNAVALISPLSLVVRNLGEQSITLSEFVFSTTPPTLTAGVLFVLGAGLYREEDMFTQRPIPLKILDMFAARVHGKWTVALVSAVLLPFVFVAELLGVAALFAVRPELSIPAILVVVVLVEEVAKSIHVYAGYAHDRFAAGLAPALVVGAFSGLGFFLGEKLTLLAQLVGLEDLQVGRAALVTGTGPADIGLGLALGLLLAPLVLHVVTAAISAVGASRNRRSYAVALLFAMAIHFLYNYTVVTASGLL